MKVIPPLDVTPARLTSSTAAEPGANETAWNSGTAYAIGDRAYLGEPSSAVTISNSAAAVITWTANGIAQGTPVVFTNSGGALPTGLTVGTVYYVKDRLTVNTFTVSETVGGGAVGTTSAGSGTHTATAHVHRVYQALTAHTNKPPMVNAADWEELGPTNKWAMFDMLRNTPTVQASPLTAVITPGQRADAVAVLGTVGDSVSVSVTSVAGGGTVYSASRDLSTRKVGDWYEYFFKAFTYRRAVAFFNLPPYTDAVITVTVTRGSGNAECGALVLGMAEDIGDVKYQAETDAMNFSTVTRDAYGKATMVARRNVPKTVQSIWCDKAKVDSVRALRDALNAEPAVWAGVEDSDDGYFESFLILGFYRKFSINAALPNHAAISLELEEI